MIESFFAGLTSGGIIGFCLGVLVTAVGFTASQQKYQLHRKGDTYE